MCVCVRMFGVKMKSPPKKKREERESDNFFQSIVVLKISEKYDHTHTHEKNKPKSN